MTPTDPVMTPMQRLKIAQDLVDDLDDSHWFNQFYSFYRQEYNVSDSIDLTMRIMDLTEKYNDAIAKVLKA